MKLIIDIKILGLILVSLVFLACMTQTNENQLFTEQQSQINSVQNISQAEIPAVVKKNKLEEPRQVEFYNIENSLGLLITDEEKRYKPGSTITIFNQDGSVWFKFTFPDQTNNEVIKLYKENLRPFRLMPNEYWVVFNCVGQNRDYYKVVVNEDTKLKKFVKKENSFFNFITWEQYILDSFAVKFNWKKNPLRKKINGESFDIEMSRRLTFHTEEIKGEWLKIRWYDTDDKEKKQPRFGWIKWKKDNKIIVQIFEVA